MIEAKIIDRGRGPEIAGTRITVYDVLDYYKEGWHRDVIASTLRLSSRQVEAAIRYIEEHRDEVMPEYEECWPATSHGQPAGASGQARRRHERFLAMVRERREAKNREGAGCGAFWRTLT